MNEMDFIKQEQSLPVICNDIGECSAVRQRHGPLLPNSLRAVIVGPSNCGKTNVMITLLEHQNGLKFENVYVYSKSLHQSKYEYLRELLKPVAGLGYYTYSNNTDVIAPNKARGNSVFIFDDVACENQKRIRDYFCMGRHFDIDVFYLCQTYTHIPKHLVRDNVNYLVIFKQDELNLRHIYNDHVNSDMGFNKFQSLCRECWKEKYGFLVIDKDCPMDQGRYRKGFDVFIKVFGD